MKNLIGYEDLGGYSSIHVLAIPVILAFVGRIFRYINTNDKELLAKVNMCKLGAINIDDDVVI